MPLEEHVEHISVFIDRSPQPVGDTAYNHVHFVQMPPGTPAGFPVAQVLCELIAVVMHQVRTDSRDTSMPRSNSNSSTSR